MLNNTERVEHMAYYYTTNLTIVFDEKGLNSSTCSIPPVVTSVTEASWMTEDTNITSLTEPFSSL